MEPDELVFEWIVWHQAVEYIKQDLQKVESANLRFPFFAFSFLCEWSSPAAWEQSLRKGARGGQRVAIK